MVTGLNLIGRDRALQDHWLKRVLALIIDALIVFGISLVLVLAAVAASFRIIGFETFVLGVGTILVGVIAILYWILQDGLMGGTVGKKALGLRVEAISGQMDIGKAVIRNISKIHWVLLLVDWLVGFAGDGDPRQKFTDRVAGTTVVRTDREASVEEPFRRMAMPAGFASSAGGVAPPAPAPPPVRRPSPPSSKTGSDQPGGTTVGTPQQAPDRAPPPVRSPRFCSRCGGPLFLRDDGDLVCDRCGAVY